MISYLLLQFVYYLSQGSVSCLYTNAVNVKDKLFLLHTFFFFFWIMKKIILTNWNSLTLAGVCLLACVIWDNDIVNGKVVWEHTICGAFYKTCACTLYIAICFNSLVTKRIAVHFVPISKCSSILITYTGIKFINYFDRGGGVLKILWGCAANMKINIKCKIWYTKGLSSNNFSQIFWLKSLKIWEKSSNFAENFIPKSGQLVYEWVTLSWKIGIPVYVWINFQIASGTSLPKPNLSYPLPSIKLYERIFNNQILQCFIWIQYRQCIQMTQVLVHLFLNSPLAFWENFSNAVSDFRRQRKSRKMQACLRKT